MRNSGYIECIGGAQHNWIDYNGDGTTECTQCGILNTNSEQ